MLGLAEYLAASADLLTRAQGAEQDVVRGEAPEKAYQAYWAAYQQKLSDTMKEVAHNAFEHYGALLGFESDIIDVHNITVPLWDKPYYGLSLNNRLAMNYQLLNRRTAQSKLTKPDATHQVLTQTVPFGAHYHTDKRLLLGTLVQVEQEVAKASAQKAGIKLIRWTTSHQHSKFDVCDVLASSIDAKVHQYIADNKLNIRPEGIYFVEDLPQPPHPNCQCEYAMVDEQGTVHMGPLQRTLQKVVSLLRKITRQ